ncbi:MAG: family 1 glycosylhydrolase [Armatimonadota bacterium]|nr:family 1 glycosylhydrolase [Armatimonadota bacterium]MDR7518622.1 family 1 glycosylhydrolase [Armatimonadota bacterium]MDR7548489.1 family 1 glycosylhydrolase [Armatimonadota bacterium]
MAAHTVRFPDDFRWGTATSAYQVEGNNTASDWWEWEQQPGRIRNGDRSGLACDWWRRAEEDFDRMAGLHQNAARLSVEWSRLEPREGAWDAWAEMRYLEMLRALRERGMEPLVTLNHFTLPRWVAERGGWLWDGIVPAFAAYAGRFVRAAAGASFGGRPLVDFWVTLNEPVGHLVSAYVLGRFAPGRTSLVDLARGLVRSVRAHAAAYHAIHRAQPEARVGLAAYLRPAQPANPRSPLDRWLAGRLDEATNWMYLNALVTGRLTTPLGLTVRIPDAAGTMDYIGVNYYTRSRAAFDLRRLRHLFIRDEPAPGAVVSDGGYSEVYPDGLLAVLRSVRRYGLPVYVTENGLPDADDDLRPGFIVEHLRRVHQAIEEGCAVRGYYHWSIVDNFEWAEGWSLRFGLYALDPATQVRTARPSAALYGEICRRNALL